MEKMRNLKYDYTDQIQLLHNMWAKPTNHHHLRSSEAISHQTNSKTVHSHKLSPPLQQNWLPSGGSKLSNPYITSILLLPQPQYVMLRMDLVFKATTCSQVSHTHRPCILWTFEAQGCNQTTTNSSILNHTCWRLAFRVVQIHYDKRKTNHRNHSIIL